MRHLGVVARGLAWGLLPWLSACGGCSKAPEPAPPPAPREPAATDPLLTVDGVTVTFGELTEAYDWLDRLGPEFSRKSKVRRVLEELVLPMAFARRDFADRRKALLALAQTVRRGVGNAAELEAARHAGLHERQTVTPRDVPMPVARFVFDPTKVLSVSDPIEVPQGFILAAAFDLKESRVPIEDQCDCLQVVFSDHDANTWSTWLRGLPERLKGRVTYVHPDYREAMPLWLELP